MSSKLNFIVNTRMETDKYTIITASPSMEKTIISYRKDMESALTLATSMAIFGRVEVFNEYGYPVYYSETYIENVV